MLSTFLFSLINYNIIIVQVRYSTIVTKEVISNGFNGFLFQHDYSGDGQGASFVSIVLYLIHTCIHAYWRTVSHIHLYIYLI